MKQGFGLLNFSFLFLFFYFSFDSCTLGSIRFVKGKNISLSFMHIISTLCHLYIKTDRKQIPQSLHRSVSLFRGIDRVKSVEIKRFIVKITNDLGKSLLFLDILKVTCWRFLLGHLLTVKILSPFPEKSTLFDPWGHIMRQSTPPFCVTCPPHKTHINSTFNNLCFRLKVYQLKNFQKGPIFTYSVKISSYNGRRYPTRSMNN